MCGGFYAGPVTSHAPEDARAVPLRPAGREPLWRHLVGGVLRQERLAQQRTLRDVADAAQISMPYLSELERGRKEASSEVLSAAARALGLGLADLLVRGQRELGVPLPAAKPARPAREAEPAGGPDDGRARARTEHAGTGRAKAAMRRDGLCLAA